jgi:hypothetical protein
MAKKKVVVFVHGWSVTHTDTYGGLPARLGAEAAAAGIAVQVKEIYLGRYVSFHDEVRVRDISRAFRAAVEDQLKSELQDGTRFVCITHSTGGPVIRDWWQRYYGTVPGSVCPMSHLIMLAPANFGSALAQLGKGRVGRLKSWLGGVEPGQGVLDWLELGSAEAWELNTDWIQNGGSRIGSKGVFPFVLTGQYIDRAFYDNLNAYTGEMGSDGVVRVAAANLNSTYIKMVQEAPTAKPGKKGEFVADVLEVEVIVPAPTTAMRVISGKSHSGKNMGIMRSVKETPTEQKSRELIVAILACLQIQTNEDYDNLCKQFLEETDTVQKNERLEVETRFLISSTNFIHDRFSMIIFRLRDTEGRPITDFDLILTAGSNSDPNHLPPGFFVDRQCNRLHPETVTYFVNRDVMKGGDAVLNKGGEVIRASMSGAGTLGFKIVARPDKGFVHYLPCEFKATTDMLAQALHRNSTTMVDIRLQRVVYRNVFRVDKMTNLTKPVDFKLTKPGDEIIES